MTQAQNDIDIRQLRALALLAVFLIAVIGIGAFIGTQTAPGTWYAGLGKSFFNPNRILGPVWFTLYAMIAIAGWRTFLAAPASAAMALWAGQMAPNWLWSPAFTAENLWPAMIIIVPMLAAILAFIVNSWCRTGCQPCYLCPMRRG
jgi:tryptophan-rich sensory protein